ncbi:hypothetical protein [Rhodopila sp.]|uniref:hypothetical protein n=1 Tax=Rhodopila sp. TaxID=2480087 RepID=UPI003D152DBD
MTDPILAALVIRRADLTGAIHKTQGELQQMHADLASLDAVIRQIDPDYKVDTIRPRYRRAPQAGEFGSISRTVLDHLRRAGKPLSAKDLAGRIVAERGLNTGDPKLRRQMNKRVDMALRYQRTNGMVSEKQIDGAVGWTIAG